MIARLTLCLCVLIVNGCTAIGVENVKKLNSGHRIAVLSVLGDEFQIDSLGTTIFHSWNVKKNVTDWQLDHGVEVFIQENLAQTGKFVVVPIGTHGIRATVDDIDQFEWDGAIKRTESLNVVVTSAKSAGADSLLIVGSIPRMDVVFHRRPSIEGYGIYQSSFLGYKEAVDYIVLRIWLVDVDSGKEIARSFKDVYATREAHEWLEEDDQLSEESWYTIKEKFREMINSAMEEMLNNLSLI
jgi:hypothetical protein